MEQAAGALVSVPVVKGGAAAAERLGRRGGTSESGIFQRVKE